MRNICLVVLALASVASGCDGCDDDGGTHPGKDMAMPVDMAMGSDMAAPVDMAQVDPIERAVLRLSAYELRFRPHVPYRVVLNEAIEVAKRFGAEHGHTYVNGVLDKAAKEWRGTEQRTSRD